MLITGAVPAALALTNRKEQQLLAATAACFHAKGRRVTTLTVTDLGATTGY